MKATWKIAVCPQCGGYTVCSRVEHEREKYEKFAHAVQDGDHIEYVSDHQLGAMRVCPGHSAGQSDLFGGKV
jgi:hypothetical protein